MMTPKENYLALIHGEKTDRLINGYEPFEFIISDPLLYKYYFGCYIEGQDTLDPFGVTIRWKKGEHAGMPYVTEENKVIKDVTEWKKYYIKQDVKFPEEAWAKAKEDCAKINRKEKLATGLVVSGVFERCHALMGFEDTLMNFLMEPEAMEELIDELFRYKYEYIKELMDHLDLDVIFYHDDLGAKAKLFFSKEIFEEFFVPRYEKLFGYVESRGAHVILHSDSYDEPFVEDFVKMHVTTWQGALCTNNFQAIQEKVKGKLVLMGGIDSIVDRADWSREEIHKEVYRAIEAGAPYGAFIPSITYGLPEAIYPGVFECITEEIDRYNEEHKNA